MNRGQAYALITRLANASEDSGLTKPRAVLLLWFLRNVVGLDDLDAYEYVCDGDLDGGIDGLYLEPAGVDDGAETLVVLQSKYPQGPTAVGVNDLKSFVGTATQFEDALNLQALLDEGVEPQLASLVDRHGIVSKLQQGKLAVRLVFVMAGSVALGHLLAATSTLWHVPRAPTI